MKRYLAPILGIGVALMVLVPTTFAVGEPGSSLYANFPQNRFPGGATMASAQLRFIDANTISLDVFVQGNDVRGWTVRVYSQGTCTDVTNWVANRKQDGTPFDRVTTNQGTVSQLLYSQDVNRVHTALANGQSLAFMLAGDGSSTAQTNSPYRTCTSFGATPPNFTTTTSTTTSPTTTTTASSATTTVTTTATTTANSTATVTATTTPVTTSTVTTTTATGACPTIAIAVQPQAVVTQTATQTVAITSTTATVTAPTVTTTATSTVPTCTTATTTGTTTSGTTSGTTTGMTTNSSATTQQLTTITVGSMTFTVPAP